MLLSEIVQYLHGELKNSAGDIAIKGCAKLDEAQPDEISFLANLKYKKLIDSSQAAAIIVSPKLELKTNKTLILVDDPYIAFALLLEKLYPQTQMVAKGISEMAYVDASAQLSEDVTVGPNCYIGQNVSIGKGTILFPNVVLLNDVSVGNNCIIYPQVTIRERCIIKNRVILQPGCVVGSDGFGFAPTPEGFKKIPQVGNVVIEDDVEIGANTAIDRSTTGSTVINKGSKLDNLVQIAHNVSVGQNTVIAGLSGIAGSTKIGNWCQIGGQAAITGHININDQTVIAGNTGIISDTESGKIYFGTPAREHKQQMLIEASLNKLPGLLKRVKKLEKQLSQNSDGEKS